MPDSSGRPDLRDIAETNGAQRRPSVVVGTSGMPTVVPGNTWIATFRQPTQPDARGPWLWLKTDPGTHETIDMYEQLEDGF